MSLEALHQGWDYPPLQRVLQGQSTQAGAGDDETPDFADALALIRLHILERQGRHQEYLYLAEAAGQTEQHLTMLARLGQIDAAMKAAQNRLRLQTEAFALAQALRQQGALAQALEIAQRGLTLAGEDYVLHELASWASELAEGLGDRPVALSARMVAFKANPSFGDYQKIQELAAESWPSVRTELLAHLRKCRPGVWNRRRSISFFMKGLSTAPSKRYKI